MRGNASYRCLVPCRGKISWISSQAKRAHSQFADRHLGCVLTSGISSASTDATPLRHRVQVSRIAAVLWPCEVRMLPICKVNSDDLSFTTTHYSILNRGTNLKLLTFTRTSSGRDPHPPLSLGDAIVSISEHRAECDSYNFKESLGESRFTKFFLRGVNDVRGGKPTSRTS